MSHRVDLTDQRFGRWTALRRSSVRSFWDCRCACGVERSVMGSSLRGGLSKSCGCYRDELIGSVRRTHGMSGHPAYTSWLHMRKRCGDPESPDYPRWGGRGIAVCDRWEQSFESFWDDMGSTWAPGLSIERRNNSGNYEPGNCKWATDLEQANNKRNNRFIATPLGEMTISQAAREYGLTDGTLRTRLKLGWEGEKLFSPARAHKVYEYA